MRRLCRTATVTALLLVALLAPGSSAATVRDTAPDPDAPAGAPPSWLPDRDWVLEHWLPYDFEQLQEALGGMAFNDIQAYVHDNVHTLADLARSQGGTRRPSSRGSSGPWRGRVAERHYRTLRRRATKTFTQSHLFAHMIGHPFHTRSLQRQTEAIFGVSSKEMAELRQRGFELRRDRRAAQRPGRAAADRPHHAGSCARRRVTVSVPIRLRGPGRASGPRVSGSGCPPTSSSSPHRGAHGGDHAGMIGMDPAAPMPGRAATCTRQPGIIAMVVRLVAAAPGRPLSGSLARLPEC